LGDPARSELVYAHPENLLSDFGRTVQGVSKEMREKKKEDRISDEEGGWEAHFGWKRLGSRETH